MNESPCPAENARFVAMIVPLMMTEVVATLGLVMLFAALRQLAVDLGSAAAAGWLVTAFILSSAVGGALLGRVGDVVGRRRVLLAVLAAAVIGSLIGCFTRSAGPLMLARTLQGLAGASMPLCIGLVRERAPPALVPRGIGLISATASISAGLGLLVGGVIVDLFDWQAVFTVLAILSVLALLGVWRLVAADPPRGSTRIEDVVGGLLFAPGIVGLLLGIEEIGHSGMADPRSWLWIVVSLALLAIWVWRELTVAQPLISVRLLLVPQIALANLALVFAALGAFQSGQMMAQFGQQPPSSGAGLGLSATGAAMLLTPINIAAGFIYARFAGLVARHGPRTMALLGGLLMAASFTGLVLVHGSVVVVEVWLAIQMVGLGMVFVTVPVVVVSACPPERVSEATGMIVVIRSTAMAIGAQVVATLLSTPGAGTHASEGTWRIVFAWGAITALAVAIVALRLPSRLQIEKAPDVP
ncbi:MFS transporter [Novosphingobium taihuense]|uniref:MFS family permease n=1 Tax=Novosphingobium taihuense TaxID=260085 RepID=A0A7W7EVG7_9SPHN|nr:MFS transporter [Novosphingobium taihuense]MBB4615438.1 MFS family permease [Novosphingobium taihuense]TWH82114.1 MFS transporter [Novosphingobium taihuense]